MRKPLYVLCAMLLAVCAAPTAPPTPTIPVPPPAPTVPVLTLAPTIAPSPPVLITRAVSPTPISPTPIPPTLLLTPTPTRMQPLVVAHRGGAALMPENTLAAFENALKIGVDMVETDVHLSKDGELIVMHDPDVSRTTDGRGQIGELTLAEIKRLNAAAKNARGGVSHQAVPTLGELLDVVRGKGKIQIEIKLGAGSARYPGIERKVVDAITARGMMSDVLIISFDFPTLKEIKSLDARLKTGALVTAAWMGSRSLASPERVVAEALDATGADYFMPPGNTVSAELAHAVRARGLKIGVWTVNAEPEMRRLAGLGVDAITSDDPIELKRVLGK